MTWTCFSYDNFKVALQNLLMQIQCSHTNSTPFTPLLSVWGCPLSHWYSCMAVPSAGRLQSVATSSRVPPVSCLRRRCGLRWSKKFSAPRENMFSRWRTLWRLAWQPCVHPRQILECHCNMLSRQGEGRKHQMVLWRGGLSSAGLECGGVG